MGSGHWIVLPTVSGSASSAPRTQRRGEVGTSGARRGTTEADGEPRVRVARGHGPRAAWIGKHLRYRWSDVEAWLELCATGNGHASGHLHHPSHVTEPLAELAATLEAYGGLLHLLDEQLEADARPPEVRGRSAARRMRWLESEGQPPCGRCTRRPCDRRAGAVGVD